MFTPPQKKNKKMWIFCVFCYFARKMHLKNTFKHPPMLVRYTFSSSAEQAGGADADSL